MLLIPSSIGFFSSIGSCRDQELSGTSAAAMIMLNISLGANLGKLASRSSRRTLPLGS
jgi:hypothetical protein